MIHIVVSRINAVPQDVERVCARKLIATRTMALVLSRQWWERKWEEKRKGVGGESLTFSRFLSLLSFNYACRLRVFRSWPHFFIIIIFISGGLTWRETPKSALTTRITPRFTMVLPAGLPSFAADSAVESFQRLSHQNLTSYESSSSPTVSMRDEALMPSIMC